MIYTLEKNLFLVNVTDKGQGNWGKNSKKTKKLAVVPFTFAFLASPEMTPMTIYSLLKKILHSWGIKVVTSFSILGQNLFISLSAVHATWLPTIQGCSAD